MTMLSDQHIPAVLIVDNEKSVRQDLGKCLRTDGYDVASAETLEEATRRAHRVDFRFAIIDMELGYGSSFHGLEAAKLISRHRPNIRVIFLSLAPLDEVIASNLNRTLSQPYGYVWTADPDENYIERTCIEIRRLEEQQPRRKCFVIMPFSGTASCNEDEWTDTFEKLIRPGVESTGTYECYRSAPLFGDVVAQIFDSLNSAEIVVADLTDGRPNVFYELGVRHSPQDASILITQSMSDVPSNLRQSAIILYKRQTELDRQKLRDELRKAVSEIERDINAHKFDRIVSPVRAYFHPPQR